MAEVIQEFLVKLGYQVDQSQHNRFKDGLKETHVQMERLNKVISSSVQGFFQLATAAGGTAIALATALSHLSLQMAGVAFQAQRVGASVGNVHALGYAFTQAGGSVEDANAALEAYANTLREIPGLENLIKQQYGVTATDRAEQLAQIGAEVRRRIESAGPVGSVNRDLRQASEILQLEQQLHLSRQQILLMLRPEMNPAFREAQRREGAFGTNWEKAAEAAQKYREELKRVGDSFSNLSAGVVENFTPIMTRELQRFGAFLEAHSKEIGGYLKDTAKNFDGVTTAIHHWWEGLHPQTQKNLMLGGAGAALFGGTAALGGILSMLRVPGGAAIANIGGLAIAIGALANDYKVWKDSGGREGGLINWDKWGPAMDAAITAVTKLHELLGSLAGSLGIDKDLVPLFEGLALFIAGTRFRGVILKTFAEIIAAVGGLKNVLGLGILATLAEAVNKTLEDLEAFVWGKDEVEQRKKFEEEHSPIMGWLKRNVLPEFMGGIPSAGKPPPNAGPPGTEAKPPAPGEDLSQADPGGKMTIPPGSFDPVKQSNLEDVMQRESGGFNRVNYRYKENPSYYTAGGYFQIVDSTWRQGASWAGVDTSKWPIAMRAPFDVQLKVASALYDHLGMSPWKESEGASRLLSMRKAMTPAPASAAASPGPSIAEQAQKELASRPPLTAPPPPPAAVPAAANNNNPVFNNAPVITVNGVSDPQMAANYITRNTDRQNADVLRRMQVIYA